MTFAARTTTTLVAVLAALAVAAPAAPSSPMSVIRDCSEDGVLNGKYSPKELDGALDQLPSGPRRVHRLPLGDPPRPARVGRRQAPRAPSRPRSPTASIAAALRRPPAKQGEIAKAAGADEAVRIGGTGVRPGESGAPFNSAGFGTDLPPLVLIVLIALGASTLAVATLTGAGTLVESNVESHASAARTERGERRPRRRAGARRPRAPRRRAGRSRSRSRACSPRSRSSATAGCSSAARRWSRSG